MFETNRLQGWDKGHEMVSHEVHHYRNFTESCQVFVKLGSLSGHHIWISDEVDMYILRIPTDPSTRVKVRLSQRSKASALVEARRIGITNLIDCRPWWKLHTADGTVQSEGFLTLSVWWTGWWVRIWLRVDILNEMSDPITQVPNLLVLDF